VYKSNGPGFLYYTGANGNWSSDPVCAARWCDRRDAWQAIVANGYVGRARTTWLDYHGASPKQVVPEEI
jgi:hypothetical protein